MEILMRKTLNLLAKLQKDEDGAAMVEYTVLLGLILAVGVTIMGTVGGQLSTTWNALSTALAGTPAP
jgi:pilus assembly protein Flp/PilA